MDARYNGYASVFKRSIEFSLLECRTPAVIRIPKYALNSSGVSGFQIQCGLFGFSSLIAANTLLAFLFVSLIIISQITSLKIHLNVSKMESGLTVQGQFFAVAHYVLVFDYFDYWIADSK